MTENRLGYRTCPKCRVEKELILFTKSQSKCKECRRIEAQQKRDKDNYDRFHSLGFGR